MVFDEVDAGIGGRTAAVVGEKLRRLGAATQVLCITHLPPIAAQAATQFAITKRVRGPRTVTTVERLDDDAREREIARMMGGEGAAHGRTPGRGPDPAGPGESAAGRRRKRKAKVGLGRKRKGGRTQQMARKYLIETYGCQMNVHDSERMAGLLEAAGFEPTDADDDADLVVINTCSVREKAEEKLYARLGDLKGLQHRDRPRADGRRHRLRRAAGSRAGAGPIAAGRRRARHAARADAADAGRAGGRAASRWSTSPRRTTNRPSRSG